jgi:hypothetical protein
MPAPVALTRLNLPPEAAPSAFSRIVCCPPRITCVRARLSAGVSIVPSVITLVDPPTLMAADPPAKFALTVGAVVVKFMFAGGSAASTMQGI